MFKLKIFLPALFLLNLALNTNIALAFETIETQEECFTAEKRFEIENQKIIKKIDAIETMLRYIGICDFEKNINVELPYSDTSTLNEEDLNIIKTAYKNSILNDSKSLVVKRIINRIDTAEMSLKLYGLFLSPEAVDESENTFQDIAKNKTNIAVLVKKIAFPGTEDRYFYPSKTLSGAELIEWMDNLNSFTKNIIKTDDNTFPTNNSDDITDIHIEEIVDMWNLVKDYLVSPIDEEVDYVELEESVLKAMFDTLHETVDPYSYYFTETQTTTNNETDYVGIGATLGINEDGKVYIDSIFEDSPAQKAGIMTLDVILEIDNTSTEGFSTENAATLIRGEEGTTVKLKLYRPSTKKNITITITRESIEISYLDSEIVEYNGKYFLNSKLKTFIIPGIIDTYKDHIKQAIESNTSISGILLDLQGNPGGYVSEVQKLIEIFVDANQTGFSFEYSNGETETFKTTEKAYTDLPLVVLVDNSSASASEIFAGAMQDLNRAEIIGQTTYGKFVAQQVFYFKQTTNGEGRFTVAKWYTPNGNFAPIVPDQIVAGEDKQLSSGFKWLFEQ